MNIKSLISLCLVTVFNELQFSVKMGTFWQTHITWSNYSPVSKGHVGDVVVLSLNNMETLCGFFPCKFCQAEKSKVLNNFLKLILEARLELH